MGGPMPRTVVMLPPDVKSPFSVFVNGVPQHAGTDYKVSGRELIFDRELAQEGRVAMWRWLVGAFGVGTYRRNDSVDVSYNVEGQPRLAQGLPIDVRG